MITKNLNAASLYRRIWRWHFYAGLFCIPFVFLLAVSGTIYLFKPQIDAWLDRDLNRLSIAPLRASPEQQVAAAQSALPGSSFINYQLPQSQRQAVVISLQHEGERKLVYLNPYTLEVLKTVAYDQQFIRLVRSFHGELLAGNVGSVLVELAGCWAIVLIITGLYLWWPRGAKGLAGVLYPRLRQGGRVLLRDLHAVTGFWIALFALFLLITGLPWALVWGSAFKEARQLGSAANGGHAHHQEAMWTISRAEEHAAHAHMPTTAGLNAQLVASATALNFAPPAFLAPDKTDPAVWRLASDHQNRTLRETAWLDANGRLLRREGFANQSMLDRAVAVGVAAHEGQLFGWFNQLLGLLTTSGIVLLSVSGFMLWRRSKPEGALGAPPALPSMAVGKVVSATVIALAMLLPLLAISLLALLVLEYVLLRHLPALRNWLGLQASRA